MSLRRPPLRTKIDTAHVHQVTCNLTKTTKYCMECDNALHAYIPYMLDQEPQLLHFAGRGGYNSREATVLERRLLGLLTPQLFQQPLVCHQKFFSNSICHEKVFLTSCYIASCYRRYQYQYGCHVQRHSLKAH